MRVLTLTQPWATLVAIGAKAVETRSLDTRHRGPLAIHAASGFPNWAKRLCYEEPFSSILLENGFPTPAFLPTGVILCTVEVEDVQRTEEIAGRLSLQELAFGNYDRGRFAWCLADVRQLAEPVPIKGFQRLWNWNEGATVLCESQDITTGLFAEVAR